MPAYSVSVPAASATVGTDLFEGEVFARRPYPRSLLGVAIAGSAAAADTEVEIMVDTVSVAVLKNSATGYPRLSDDLVPLRAAVPAGAQLRAIVRDAPATNPINVVLMLSA